MQEGNYEGGMSVTNARKDPVLALETAQELGVLCLLHWQHMYTL